MSDFILDILKKDKGGRPPIYKSGDEIVKVALTYFNDCKKNDLLPTKAGLMLTLRISRDTYSEYRKKFTDTINKIDSYIELCWSGRLKDGQAIGAIFYLKNAFKEDYKDRQVFEDNDGKAIPLAPTINVAIDKIYGPNIGKPLSLEG